MKEKIIMQRLTEQEQQEIIRFIESGKSGLLEVKTMAKSKIYPDNAVVNGQRSGEQRDITILPRDYYARADATDGRRAA